MIKENIHSEIKNINQEKNKVQILLTILILYILEIIMLPTNTNNIYLIKDVVNK